MSDPYLGEIRLFGFSFAPAGWLACNGSTLPINQYQALYSLIGNQFGGAYSTGNFNLPDLRGRVPFGASFPSQNNPSSQSYQGYYGGAETVTLVANQMPGHIHTVNVTAQAGNKTNPSTNVYAQAPTGVNIYASPSGPGGAPVALSPDSISPAGAGGGHNNVQPFSVVNFCIAKTGTYPSRP
ncbi:MAG: phage tail protein [Magnetococcales bacterium]|nr:phage tail protein [Magnetococcales bacterium]